MKLFSALLICLFVVSTTALQLRSLSAEKILDLLRRWNLADEFLSAFEDEGYDGFALDVMTKEDLDAEFPNSSRIHRRALYSRIQELKNPHRVSRNLKEVSKNGPKPAAYFKEYTGAEIMMDKGWVTFGKDKDAKIYRGEKGTLIIDAAAIDFRSAKLTINGKPVSPKEEPPKKEPPKKPVYKKIGAGLCRAADNKGPPFTWTANKKLGTDDLAKMCDAMPGCIGFDFGKQISTYLRFISTAALNKVSLPSGFKERVARSSECQSNCKITKTYDKWGGECWSNM